MRDLLLLTIHLLVTVAKVLRPGGVRAVAAESLLLKQQIIIGNRSRRRAPNLTSLDRFVLGLLTVFIKPHRTPKLSAILKSSTLFKIYKAMVDHKYRQLFSSTGHRRKPGPKGPSPELIAAIVEMKLRNPKFGWVRIAQQISHTFGIDIDKDVVRRVLAQHYRLGDPGSNGPSWLALTAQSKNSLWSLDLFRCESILLRSYWVLVVMDIFIRRIVGFGIAREHVDGVIVCRMFNQAVAGQARPMRISTDNDPVFRFHRSLDGTTPAQRAGAALPRPAALNTYTWRQHCQGLFQTPMAA